MTRIFLSSPDEGRAQLQLLDWMMIAHRRALRQTCRTSSSMVPRPRIDAFRRRHR